MPTHKLQVFGTLKGNPGDSAYQVAVQNGFEGTEEEWLASLVGPQGDPPTDEQVESAVNQYLDEHGVSKPELDTTLTQSGQAADAKATGDKILQFAIKNTMQGKSPLVVPDSAEEGILGFGLTGKTEQFSTTGKNLFDITAVENKGEGQNEIELIDGKLVVVKPVAYPVVMMTNAKFLEKAILNSNNKKIVISAKVGSNVEIVRIYISCVINNVDNEKNISSNSNTPLNLEGLTEIKSVRLQLFMKDTTLIDNSKNYATDIQFEIADKVTDYEPYTGGKPSPSPDYPQEIVNVGKWNEETGRYEVKVKFTGKNLFDKELLRGQWLKGAQYYYLPIHVGKGATISFTTNKSLIGGLDLYALLSKSPGGIDAYSWLYHSTQTSLIIPKGTFTANSDIIYLSFTGNKNILFDNLFNYLQVEISDKPTQYEPYKSQSLTLTSDRPITKWDKLVEQDGQIGWLYKSKQITLNGSESWIKTRDPESPFQCFYTNIENVDFRKGALCKTYRFHNAPWSTTEYGLFGENGYVQKSFRLPYEGFEIDVNVWKEFIKDNPLVIWSMTLDTEFVPLPQSEQDAIRALATYYPTTVITTDSGELNPDVELDYVADTRNFVLGQIGNTNKELANTQAQLL